MPADHDYPHGDGPCPEEHGDERPTSDVVIMIIGAVTVAVLAAVVLIGLANR